MSRTVTTERGEDHVTRLAFAAGRGDSAALEQFIRATQTDVWRTVAYLGDAGSADDLTQETFMRAITALPRFSGRSSARTWLLSIARRVVVDQIRHKQSRPRTQHGVDVEQEADFHHLLEPADRAVALQDP
ncbi:sigma-70 family RNA polymerase sigma factor, partial [Mycolicibacterium conceptionense]|uniref:sigma-70 family RNA polymerase sigma factor n=1 Tax=Mycolicibacterium conceptionense TaxID=451644 RepID=UPI0020C200F3